MLRFDQEALGHLQNLAQQMDASASSYWQAELPRFDVDVSGKVGGLPSMGNAVRRRGKLYDALHWLLQAPFRRIGRAYPDFARCQRIVRGIALRQNRQYSEDMLRQALAGALILRHLPAPLPTGVLVVIGDGFGVMSSLLRSLWPDRVVVPVNLGKPLLLDLASIRLALPGETIAFAETAEEMAHGLADGKAGIIGVRADDAAFLDSVPIALAVNMESMQEMDPPIIAAYFDLLRRNPAERTVFYCCNRREKTLYDGTILRFVDYPWRAGDRLLVDEACAWSALSYHTRPPFWIHRPADYTQHRLADLEKA